MARCPHCDEVVGPYTTLCVHCGRPVANSEPHGPSDHSRRAAGGYVSPNYGHYSVYSQKASPYTRARAPASQQALPELPGTEGDEAEALEGGSTRGTEKENPRGVGDRGEDRHREGG